MTRGGMKLAEEGQSGEREFGHSEVKIIIVEVDVECMHTKFDGRSLNSFLLFVCQ